MLTSRDVAQLRRTMNVLLAPGCYQDEHEWRIAANNELRPLLQADWMSFMLPLDYSNRFLADYESIAHYPQVAEPHDIRLGLWRKQVRMGVWSRAALWGKALQGMYKSTYYNEFVIPVRGFDTLGLTVDIDGKFNLGGLMFFHERVAGRKFGTRGLMLSSLLFPVFRAGVRAWHAIQQQRENSKQLVDCLAQPALLVNQGGKLLHANSAFDELRRGDAQSALLLAAALRFGRDTAVLITSVAPKSEFSTATQAYTFSASFLGHPHELSERYLLVLVTRRAPAKPTAQQLLFAYGLTEKEAAVALMVFDRLNTEEIAANLSVTTHTVRRHLEKVMQKTGTHSRAEIRQAFTPSS